jgi:multidrug resistance efflux pump
MLLLVSVLLGLAAVIPYPEKVEAPFVLQTQMVPLAVNVGAGGVIEAVLAADGTTVVPGDTLLVLRSETDWRTVRRLDQQLTVVEKVLDAPQMGEVNTELTGVLAALSELPATDRYPANIQTPYTRLRTTLRAYQSYQETNGVAAEVMAYEREITDAHRLSTSLNKQVALYQEELAYQEKQAQRMTWLEADGIVSAQEAEQAAVQAISARRQQEAMISSDIQNQLRVQQLRQQILQRKNQHQEQLADFDRQLLAQLRQLRAALDAFRERYVLIARESGTISWLPATRPQAVVSPKPLGYLLPRGDERIILARVELPAIAQGQVAEGDHVVLDFAAYPGREYGQVSGTVISLDPVATLNAREEYVRRAEIALNDGMMTSYGKQLPFQYNLTGSARFIVAQQTFLERLFDQFLNLTQNT